MGFQVNVDDALIDEVGEHFRSVAEQRGQAARRARWSTTRSTTSTRSRAACCPISARSWRRPACRTSFDAVLEECARVRSELGWPIMITPFAQFVGTQAVLNVVQGERYRMVPDEVKKYALGYYGKLLAPVDPDVARSHRRERLEGDRAEAAAARAGGRALRKQVSECQRRRAAAAIHARRQPGRRDARGAGCRGPRPFFSVRLADCRSRAASLVARFKRPGRIHIRKQGASTSRSVADSPRPLALRLRMSAPCPHRRRRRGHPQAVTAADHLAEFRIQLRRHRDRVFAHPAAVRRRLLPAASAVRLARLLRLRPP